MINVEKYDNTTSKCHFYEEYLLSDKNCIKEHLTQSVQYFYSRMHYQPEIEEKTGLHEILYRIDFPDPYKGKVMIQTSFTYLHWKIAEALEKEDTRYSADKLDEEQFKMLIMNIFPQGRTLLHYLWDNPDQIKCTFQRLKEVNAALKIPFVLPFIRNF